MNKKPKTDKRKGGKMNNLTIVGRVTKDPTMKTTQYGDVCFLSVAVNDAGGKADYFSVKLTEKQAENTMKYVQKGDVVSVQGSVHLNQWGANRENATLSMDKARCEFYGKRNDGNHQEDNTPKTNQNAPKSDFSEIDDEDMPF